MYLQINHATSLNKKRIISFLHFLQEALLNSYSMLFFSKHRVFAVLIMAVSFFNPYTGIGGFYAVLAGITFTSLIGLRREDVITGLYTYGTLLVGLGMGTFYELSMGYWVLLTFASLFSVLLSAVLIAHLGKHNLPALSLPFILTLWLVILTAGEFSTIGLTERNIYWLNEMYASGGSGLISLIQRTENLEIPKFIAGFFRSLSAIIFQSNMAAGIILAIGLFLHSRISLLLVMVGYATAIVFIQLMGGYTSGVNYYNLGTNFMLVSVALGGFYIIPSTRSFLWTMIMVPISYLLVIGLWKVTGAWNLPVFSLPFCVTVLLFLYAAQLTRGSGRPILTPVQYHSPEENLYRYLNGRDRLEHRHPIAFSLPFIGEWTVSQGYDGSITHKGDWSKAIDFVILDEEMKTFRPPAADPHDFHCYNKPVLAPADGIVEQVVDHVPDNRIGENNIRQNWGNTIVIRHGEGIYSKLSHLRMHSLKAAKGMYVKKGDIIAFCGNSGRSPEPHLHFQLQSTPYIDSRTFAYPFAWFLERKGDRYELKGHTVPEEGTTVCEPVPDGSMQEAFRLQPGMRIKARAAGHADEEWEVCVSPFNETYLKCESLRTYAYFLNDGTVFHFTQFFGKRDSLLFLFYQAAYKVLLSTEKKTELHDRFPLQLVPGRGLRWIQDLLSPFHIFMSIHFHASVRSAGSLTAGNSIFIDARQESHIFRRSRTRLNTSLEIVDGKLAGFTAEAGNNKTIVSCEY
jgi:urea transporter